MAKRKPERKAGGGRRKAAGAAQAPTTEQLDEQARQALAFHHKKRFEQLLAAKKKADADFKNGCKLARAELGADAIATIKDMIDAGTEAGEARLKASINRQLQAARWMGVPVGVQGDLFGEPDRTPLVDRAREEGRRASMENEARKPPYDPSTEAYRAWMAGYDEDQKRISDGFMGGGSRLKTSAGAGEQLIKDAVAGKVGTAPATHEVRQ